MKASEQYFETSVSTQQRGKLIVMLYDGAVKFLKIAREKMAAGDYALKGVYIGKAQDIVAELNNCLSVEAAPRIANDLRTLYNFICRHLNEANIERSQQKIDDCIRILEELREAWQEVASKPEPAVAGQRPAVGGFEA